MATDLLKLLNNLRQMIKQQTDLNQLTGVKHKLKRLVGLIEVTLKKHGDPDKREFMKSIKEVISKAEEFVETYGKKVSESETAGIYKKPVHWVQLFCMRKRLKEIKHDIKDVRKKFLLPDSTHDLKHASDDSLAEKAGFWDQYYWMQCMYHLLIFPADVEVPKRRLIALWVAEGLIGPKDNQSESDEQVAERYLHELIKLEKVLVAKKKRNGKVQACKLNREMCLPGPVEDDSTADEHDSRAEEGDLLRKRRLVDHSGIDSKEDGRIKIHGNPNISQSVPKHGNFVSFLSFDTNQEDNPGEDIGNFLQSCIWAGCFLRLKVLDLEGVFRPKLPRTLGKLIHLKYLGLRWTYLEELPDFVNKLLNLQVLDVKHTYFSFLPSSIWSMQYLRHLYLSEVNGTRFPERPSTDVSLTALQTLWGAFIDEKTCVTGGLDTLENIRKLGLSCSPSRSGSSMLKQLKAVDKWISNLKFLESLRLKSRDKDGKASDLCLSSLKGNISLSTVYLLGKLSPCVVCEFPKSITDVTLSVSELDLDPMQFLGKLPKLVILRLLGQSVVHNRMHCSRGSFPQLKILHIWKLENLEEWEVDDGSLPYLEELDIRSCKKLNMRHWSERTFPHLKILRIWELENLEKWEVKEWSLPCLEELEIRSCNKLNKMHCSSGGYCRPKVLKIWKLENLEEWKIEDGSVPCLEELEIGFCNKLNRPVFHTFPERLTRFTLSESMLDLEGLLDVCLQIRSRSVMHVTMHCSRGDFHWLEVKLQKSQKNWEKLEEESPPCLTELEITSCKKLNRPLFHKLPESLTRIILSGSELDEDPMQLLNRLPNLQYLELLDQSAVCHKMHSSRGDFPKLKLLRISKLENLEKWEIEEGSLPSLEELEIRFCQKLKMLPDGLRHVTTFKKLRLTNMPRTFINQTKATHPQLWANKIEVATEVGKNNPN